MIIRKIETGAKIVLAAAGLSYVLFYPDIVGNRMDVLFYQNVADQYQLKKRVGLEFGKVNATLLGGSNVLWGISAEQISRDIPDFRTVNLAVFSEMDDFDRYLNYVSQHVSNSGMIIYSSMNIWMLTKKHKENGSNPDARLPVISFLSHVIVNGFNTHKGYNITPFGDLDRTTFNCTGKVYPYAVPNSIDAIQAKALTEFASRAEKMKASLHAASVYYRFPPVLVTQHDLPAFEHYLAEIKSRLTAMNIKFIPQSTPVILDPGDVCFGAQHVTADVRTLHTKELISTLIGLRELSH